MTNHPNRNTLPVYDCHPHDFTADTQPIGRAKTVGEAEALVKRHYCGTGEDRPFYCDQDSREHKSKEIWAWWTYH